MRVIEQSLTLFSSTVLSDSVDEGSNHLYRKPRKKGAIVGAEKLSLVWTQNYFGLTVKYYIPDNSFPIILFLPHMSMEKRKTILRSSQSYFNLIMETVFFWSLFPNSFLRFSANSIIFYLKCERFEIFLNCFESENSNSIMARILWFLFPVCTYLSVWSY